MATIPAKAQLRMHIDTRWTTKILKEGDKYTKAAFKKGEADGKPANSSAAEKVK
jgi:hypothetical protein